METDKRKDHWDHLYENKKSQEMSWYQPTPSSSLELIRELKLPRDAAIIDIGGGEGFLAENLLHSGYVDITVLDVSDKGIEKGRARMGSDADRIKWIVGDATTFRHKRKYDLWHDRASFHFLTNETEINDYLYVAEDSLVPGGMAVIGTFAKEAPEKCSGLEVWRYSEEELTDRFVDRFAKIKCLEALHKTPNGGTQPFVFCVFRRK